MRGALIAVLFSLWAVPVGAQEATPAQEVNPVEEDQPQIRLFPSPVLVFNRSRLYAESEFGQRIETQYDTAGRALEAENAAFQAELEAEERSIAERRESMTVEEFRAEAEAFDIKVQQIRAQQDARVDALEAARLAGQEEFYARSRPILGQLMIDNRAVVLLEDSDAYLFLTSIDITDQAIAAVNALLGDGTDPP